tara:strand:+ start:3965 stop:6451 length:2487 start_codon:yes stop_codon:yes gene_type:complete
MSNRITAILGPTNTGKTFLAVETMLGFESGIFGFPLRLLAREIYDKCTKKVGKEKVALVTGEEKIIPPNPKYFICTVECMPKDLSVDFIAIDEVQMCTDKERGHIFTDALLNYRGNKLTMLLGSNIMKNIITTLVGDVEFVKRERFSKLSYDGYKKISRLSSKTAIIAFSIEEVYAIAELVRRQKGGAAVIMGSLSPKTRNAQVELYQSGEVDFLVATDAIGMGLNMDIDNVYFSNLKKFDGRKTRNLGLVEIAQIAGRAGRYTNDGYFGITGQCEKLSSEDIENLENHKFEPLNKIYWRNSNLNFDSFNNLVGSIEEKSKNEILKRINDCEDEKVLKFLLKNNSGIKIKDNNEHVKTLWECCQIPDFSKKAYGQHIEVVKTVYNFLTSKPKKVSNEYMKDQLKELDKYLGNIDALANRISHVRTWAYVANKKNWVQNQDYWIERTKDIEDKLSEKLHEELTKSFIDKRISVLSRGLKDSKTLETKIIDDGKVMIDAQYIGQLKGLKLFLDFQSSSSINTDLKSLKKAARHGIAPELMRRVSKIKKNKNLSLKNDYKIYWENNPIAFISAGKNYLDPRIDLIVDEAIDIESKEDLKKFLSTWLKELINSELNDLVNLNKDNIKNKYVRALCFRLFENNGVLKRELVNSLTKILSKEDRNILRKMGVKIGRYHIFLPKMLKPGAVALRINLWENFFYKSKKFELPKSGLNFLKDIDNVDKKFLLICGFENFDKYYIRVDILERLFLKIIEKTIDGKFELESEMLNLIGCSKENFIKLLTKMQYKYTENKILKKEYFSYKPKKISIKKKKENFNFTKDNPFKVLTKMNFK